MPVKDNQREDARTAYIAGLIDGEGSIMIIKMKEKWGLKYQAVVSIVNTDRRLVEIPAKLLGAKRIYVHDPSTNGFKGRKLCYKCKIQGTRKMIEPLKLLLPYLVCKKEQAKLALRLCEKMTRSKPTKTKKGKHRISAGEARWREKIYQKYISIARPQRLTERTPERVK